LFPGQPTPRLYDCVVEALRTRDYSRRTEEAYLHWIRRFLVFHNGTHPREMAEMDFNRFLTHLAVGTKVAASTQNQALAAVLFLCEHVLEGFATNEEINHADFRAEIKGNSAAYVCQVYDAPSGTLWAKP
jgi:hypothetical protein